ncbi:MAG: rhodanese-like domain-containing protein [Deltaproteobacteria bacterium]|nr:rhodanese-like domain-containing protein [Deltaproteobacteria bacterium]
MKKILIFSFFILLSAVTAGAVLAASHRRITGDELKTMIKKGEKLKIVDVREPELFEKGHVPGAINIPYDEAHVRIIEELKPSEKIVFICHGGPMGDELATILVNRGYKDVYNVKGGMRKWKGPLTTK